MAVKLKTVSQYQRLTVELQHLDLLRYYWGVQPLIFLNIRIIIKNLISYPTLSISSTIEDMGRSVKLHINISLSTPNKAISSDMWIL